MTTKPPSPSSPNLSLWERLDLLPAGLSIFGTVLYSALTGLFRGKTGAKTYRLHVSRGLIHKLVMRLSSRQAKYLATPTEGVYRNWVSGTKGVQAESTVPLNHGAKGLWIGDKNAKNVLVYYHGGGFALPATPDHFTYISHLITTITKTTNQDIAIFFLSYTTTADAFYPTQLTQAIEALRYILTTTSTETGTPRSPSNVFLGGDSAGGNLALSVLLHLTHPHPEIDPLPVVTDEEPLGGVFAIAPWVSFRTDWPSMQENEYKDLITAPELEKWASAYLGTKPGDLWSEPFLAPKEWWEGFRAKGLLVTAGGNEILLSCVEAIVEKVRDGVGSRKDNVVFKVGDGETHVPMAYGPDLDALQGFELEKWLAGRLS